ncbi:hypothetical protein AXG93_2931s1630 [Marchantia polymorpha subsp. ruderalis]|uniref:Uncharacterized protein n=1 Tax=Marchantia polymorpha subsp. ruderalis TaxID=1480154 RepID=A0A176VVT9_MARPO|nr:hypothetical protein AXG93_2931s1630 [Marchantia polymorpha subsp. ruderalis]
MVSSNSFSSERTRSVGSEDVPQPKIGGEVATEVMLSEAILEQIVAEVGGTVGNQVEEPGPPPLEEEYLDTKREKYTVRKESGSYVKLIRNRTKLKRAVAVKREWNSATELAKERAAILSAECAAAKAALKEQEDQLREKEIECKVLQLNLAQKSGRFAELEKTCGGLCVSTENAQKVTVDLLERLEKSKEAYAVAVQRSKRLITTTERRKKMHAETLAKVEARIAEEVCIAEELWWKIAEVKTAEEDLRSKIAEIASKCDMEFRRAEELLASMSEGFQKHEE